jgi:NAD(P)-dependent dehydrogenase (short-subunit alcohol dehydrogenase family)
MSRTVLITGAAGGIGRAAVEYFAHMGWRVVGVDRADWGDGFPQDGLFIRADVSVVAAFETLFGQVSRFTDRLDAVVNNAAVQVSKPLLETTPEEWDAVMAANLRSAFLVLKYAHPLLRSATTAAVVNVSSVHALQTSHSIAAYAASKGGLLALTRAMAIEFAEDRIRVNAVLPGAVDTPMLRAGLGRGASVGSDITAQLDALAKRTVNGRIGQPAEIARAVYFLADEEQSSFMTGQALVVDGGATIRLSTE